jgi:hypothetical protein
MKLDTNPFPIGMVELEHKKILVHMDQDETTKGESIVISDDLQNRMIKPPTQRLVCGRRMSRGNRLRG